MHTKKFASNRTDLTVISELRNKLTHLSNELERIDPDVARQVDEDYKVAKHYLSMAELERLQSLTQQLEQQVQKVLDGDNPLLKRLKTPVEDILRKAADDLVREIERPLGFLRGQISKETLDAVDPTKKDPTE